MFSTYDQWKLRSPDDETWVEPFYCEDCEDAGCPACCETQPIEMEDLDEMCGTEPMAIDWNKRADEWIDLMRQAPRKDAVELLAHYLRSAEIEGGLNVLQDLRKLNNEPDEIDRAAC